MIKEKLLEIEKYLLEEFDIKTLSLKDLTTYYNLLNSIQYNKKSEEKEKMLMNGLYGFGLAPTPVRNEE